MQLTYSGCHTRRTCLPRPARSSVGRAGEGYSGRREWVAYGTLVCRCSRLYVRRGNVKGRGPLASRRRLTACCTSSVMRTRSRRWRVLKVWAARLTNARLNLFSVMPRLLGRLTGPTAPPGKRPLPRPLKSPTGGQRSPPSISMNGSLA